MSNVVRMLDNRPFPDLTVFEFAVASAISRQVIATDEELQEVLSDWFLRQVRPAEVAAALDSMAMRGIVRRGDDTLCGYGLTSEGINAVATLYGGCIRMIDRGLGLLNTPMILSLLNLIKETRHA